MKITDRPAIVFLSALLSAFVGGVTAYAYLLNTIENTAEKKVIQLVESGKLKGEKGEPGNQGAKGERGTRGDPGIPGRDGHDGARGADGTDLDFPVGTIISSVLKPNDLAHHYGENWRLADGSEVTTRDRFYLVSGTKKLPDLRGVFLRGLNFGRSDQFKDPDISREVGDPQYDAFQGHWHYPGDLAGVKHGIVSQNYGEGGIKGESGNGLYWTAAKFDPSSDGKNGEPRTSSETRPKNVAVYFYIKIN
ncbi:collagen-like protein [Puniceicoccaceae bacterium K14]|nr:collagen-like protein [Puniceicoccaceae bacterium K14]